MKIASSRAISANCFFKLLTRFCVLLHISVCAFSNFVLTGISGQSTNLVDSVTVQNVNSSQNQHYQQNWSTVQIDDSAVDPKQQNVSPKFEQTTKCMAELLSTQQQVCWSTKWVERREYRFCPHFKKVCHAETSGGVALTVSLGHYLGTTWGWLRHYFGKTWQDLLTPLDNFGRVLQSKTEQNRVKQSETE